MIEDEQRLFRLEWEYSANVFYLAKLEDEFKQMQHELLDTHVTTSHT